MSNQNFIPSCNIAPNKYVLRKFLSEIFVSQLEQEKKFQSELLSPKENNPRLKIRNAGRNKERKIR